MLTFKSVVRRGGRGGDSRSYTDWIRTCIDLIKRHWKEVVFVVVVSGLVVGFFGAVGGDLWKWVKATLFGVEVESEVEVKSEVSCLHSLEQLRVEMMASGGWESDRDKKQLLREKVDETLLCADSTERGQVVVWLFEMGALGGKEGRGEPIDMTGVDLRDADLRDKVIPGIDLADADLTGADLRGVDLDGEDGRYRADFGGITGPGIRLQGAEARGIVLTGANLRGSQLCRAILLGARIDHMTGLHDARLKDAQLEVARLTSDQLRSADFDSECD